MINAIVAVDEQLGIGANNTMPWPKNKADMKWFRDNTYNGVVVMGRRTWESIGKKNLPNRINVVITTNDISNPIPHNSEEEQPHWMVHGNIEIILRDLERMYPNKTIWVIGGANIFQQAMPFVEKLFITTIKGDYNCDVFLDKKSIDGFNEVIYNEFFDDNTQFEIRGRCSEG